jgi:hypothetical protein
MVFTNCEASLRGGAVSVIGGSVTVYSTSFYSSKATGRKYGFLPLDKPSV